MFSLWTKRGSYSWRRDSVPDASTAFPPLHADSNYKNVSCSARIDVEIPRARITTCGQAKRLDGQRSRHDHICTSSSFLALICYGQPPNLRSANVRITLRSQFGRAALDPVP